MSVFTRMLGKPDEATIPYASDSLEGLIARWVQWGASSKVEVNPIADFTGEYSGNLQPEDVWFLAGCFGGVVERTCVIPGNKKLLVPVFNMWFTEHYQPPDLSKAHGFMTLNGQEVPLDTIRTKDHFVVRGVWGNPVTGSILPCKMRVGGLWKLLDPLPVGEHELYFRGGDGDGFFLEVTYKLKVLS
ncbi:hypothetical protein [Hahella ganghwensis]|uniref:hypothetical protein n=1 Tax=Hahella ganghwensis TaxID=286420 RepID=UPI00037783FF|nr:hypothetical protein [Hahella ganghwensis]